MARIIRFDVTTGAIIEDLPSANTGLFIDEEGNPLPGILINPDTSKLIDIDPKFWIVDLKELVVRVMTVEEIRTIELREASIAKRQEALQRVDKGRALIAEIEAEMVLLEVLDDDKAFLISEIHDVLIMLMTGQLQKARSLAENLLLSAKVKPEVLSILKNVLMREIQ